MTYVGYKVFNRQQESGERLESFHAALTAQGARYELGTLVRELFISKMKKVTLQGILIFRNLSPGEVLKRALNFKHRRQTTQAFQTTNANTANATQSSGSQNRIQQEPIMKVGIRVRTADEKARRSIKENNRRVETIHELRSCSRCC